MGQDSDKQFVFEVAYGGATFEQAIQDLKGDEESDGVTVLFFGATDEEKTTALDALAEAVGGVNIHQVDLEPLIADRAEVTQGGIRETFDAAGEGAALLYLKNGDAFFDQEQEAAADEDSLTPVDYLLQRMESFKGIVVLSLADATHLQRTREVTPVDLVVTF
ncbi:MAG TPA: AAA family ATPase [Rhodothermales bacterium]|nr:AAA family ATPase [Rhodothermales bacterium]